MNQTFRPSKSGYVFQGLFTVFPIVFLIGYIRQEGGVREVEGVAYWFCLAFFIIGTLGVISHTKKKIIIEKETIFLFNWREKKECPINDIKTIHYIKKTEYYQDVNAGFGNDFNQEQLLNEKERVIQYLLVTKKNGKEEKINLNRFANKKEVGKFLTILETINPKIEMDQDCERLKSKEFRISKK